MIFTSLCLLSFHSRVELKRLCEIFTRMFADPHSKVCECMRPDSVHYDTQHSVSVSFHTGSIIHPL